jgi:hypothetical protein
MVSIQKLENVMAIHLIRRRFHTMTGKPLKLFFTLAAISALAVPAQAASLIDLYDWGFNFLGWQTQLD